MAAIRCWFVERELDDGRVLTLTYATPDGERIYTRQQALAAAREGVPAAVEVDPADLEPVDESDRRERLRTEVQRTKREYESDELV